MSTTKIYTDLFQNEGSGTVLRNDIIPNTPVYVAPNGNDSNDGLTEETAVATFARAINLAESYQPGTQLYIYVVGGTYNNQINIVGPFVSMKLLGDVVINQKTISVSNGGTLAFWGSHNLSIENANITSSAAGAYFGAKLLFVDGVNFSVTGTKTNQCLASMRGSIVYFESGCNFTANVSTLTGNKAIEVIDRSLMYFTSSATVNGSVNVSNLSCLSGGALNISQLSGSTSTSLLYSGGTSSISVGNLSFTTLADGISYLCVSDNNAFIYINNLTANGKVTTAAVQAHRSSAVMYYVNGSKNGTLTGPRWHVEKNSIIDVGGAGANRLPGNAAGTTVSASYGYYC